MRFFRRGQHHENFEIPRWHGFGTDTVEAPVYDDVVMFVALKPDARDAHKRRKTLQRRIRPGSVLIKYFRNIASSDLNALFPNVQVVMSTFDKLFLGVPAIAGGIPILFKLASTVTVLFLVVGFYLGISASIEDDQMKGAFAAMSGLIALHCGPSAVGLGDLQAFVGEERAMMSRVAGSSSTTRTEAGRFTPACRSGCARAGRGRLAW